MTFLSYTYAQEMKIVRFWAMGEPKTFALWLSSETMPTFSPLSFCCVRKMVFVRAHRRFSCSGCGVPTAQPLDEISWSPRGSEQGEPIVTSWLEMEWSPLVTALAAPMIVTYMKVLTAESEDFFNEKSSFNLHVCLSRASMEADIPHRVMA